MYVSTLIYSDGTPRPGVTTKQLKDAIDTVKKLKSLINEGNQEISALNKKSQESHNEVRNHLLGLEKKYKCKLSNPLLRKMFNL